MRSSNNATLHPDRNPLSRRYFLRGAGGFTLALPLLPSLFPRRVLGAPIANARPNFFAMATEHGGIDAANMYPLAAATQTAPLLTGHGIRHGALARTVNGNKASLSPVLTADASKLTDRLVSKMNVLRGLDIPFYISHHAGGHLGNYGERQPTLEQKPTIDQIMAWSPNFYSAQEPMKKRSVTMVGEMAWDFSNPAARSGAIQKITPEGNSKTLFDSLFAGGVPQGGPAPRPLIVDRVLENYRRLRNGNRRISTDDGTRLDAHMTRLLELERQVTNNAVPTRLCSDVKTPTVTSSMILTGGAYPGGINDPVKGAKYYQLLNDIVAAAFTCGYSRIVTMRVLDTFAMYVGSWHQEVAHQHSDPVQQVILMNALQTAFESVFVDLMNKLNVDAGNGRTLLDDTLMVWTQESGRRTHDSDSIPIVTAGGASGFFNTGHYVDYRNTTPAGNMHNSNHSLQVDGYTGLLYNRWLATALQSMRIPQTEWQVPGYAGYGVYGKIDSQFIWNSKPLYVPGVVESSNDPLPIITG